MSVIRSTISRVVVVVIAITGLVVACGGNGDTASDDVVTIGNIALTDRQEEMVQLSDQYLAAWKSLDPAAVTALFAPDGTIESILYDDEFRISDGTLTDRVQAAMNAFDMASLERVGPQLVDGDMVYGVSRAGPQTFSTLLVFTPSGTVQILRHISLNS